MNLINCVTCLGDFGGGGAFLLWDVVPPGRVGVVGGKGLDKAD